LYATFHQGLALAGLVIGIPGIAEQEARGLLGGFAVVVAQDVGVGSRKNPTLARPIRSLITFGLIPARSAPVAYECRIIVKCDAQQIGRGRRAVESLSDRVRMQRAAVLVGEYIVAGVIVVSEERALLVLDFAPAAQCVDGGVVDGNRLVGVACLTASLVAGLAANHDTVVVHGDFAPFEIYGVPFQTADLPTSEVVKAHRW
jgi:hypothetical protein